MTHKSYKFRFYPNLEQENHLAREFGCARFVYNKSLGLIKDAWFEENKNISYSDVSKMLAQWKKEGGKEPAPPSIVFVFFRMFKYEILTSAMFKLCADTLQFANPFLLK